MLLKDKVQNCIENQIPIRLHLGCGPVKLPDYLNVDGEYCAGDPEIIIHDIAMHILFPITVLTKF